MGPSSRGKASPLTGAKICTTTSTRINHSPQAPFSGGLPIQSPGTMLALISRENDREGVTPFDQPSHLVKKSKRTGYGYKTN